MYIFKYKPSPKNTKIIIRVLPKSIAKSPNDLHMACLSCSQHAQCAAGWCKFGWLADPIEAACAQRFSGRLRAARVRERVPGARLRRARQDWSVVGVSRARPAASAAGCARPCASWGGWSHPPAGTLPRTASRCPASPADRKQSRRHTYAI